MTTHRTKTTERTANADERCTCGRPAVIVYQTPTFGDVPYCGIPDGGQDRQPTAEPVISDET